ncbi:MAG: translocation/assembly module TamB domain-containing protein [Rhodocyclales bacterium]|nr:translocation/assembly module TamB domain-containing protein [Rhodocyclales bacterium]
MVLDRGKRPLRRIGRALLATLVSLLLTAAGAAAWLLCAESGLTWAAATLARLSNDAVRIEGARGRLVGPLTLARVDIAAGAARYSAHDVALRWTPRALVDGVLAIDALHVGRIDLTLAAAAAAAPPEDLQLPLAVRVGMLEIGRIDVREGAAGATRPLASELRAVLASDGKLHRIAALSLRLGAGTLTGQGTLDAVAPFALAATAELAAAGPPALRVKARAAGTLDAIALDLDGPHAVLTLELDLARNAAGALAGGLRAANAAPAALDRGGLPFSRVAAALTVDGDGVPRRLRVDGLTLTQGRAELAGSGELRLDAARAWRFAGRLRHVDPAAIAALPPADLNASFDTAGELAPRLAGRLRFVLGASRYAGQALAGNGDVAFTARDAAHLLDDLLAAGGAAQLNGALALQLGASRLSVQGGWGSRAERLSLKLTAPDLAQHRRWLPGLAGALDLTAVVSGFSAQPQLVLDVHGRKLVLAGGDRIARLDAAASLQGEMLSLKLTAETLSRPEGPQLARAELTVAGTRAQHRLHATADLPAGRGVELTATGRLIEAAQDWRDTAWRGTLERFSVTGDWPVLLLAPMKLAASRRELVLGAGVLALAAGRVELAETTWTPQRWSSRGRFSALALRLNGAADKRAAPALADGDWALAGQTDGSLAGHLRASVPDLSGLGPAIDGNLSSAGALAIDAAVSGSIAAPRLHGSVRGSGLALGLIDQNLHLREGTLVIRFDGARAVVERLDFVARHDPPGRAARLAGFAAPAEPGRLAVSGELDLQRRQAHLDATLVRLPLSQQPDRWLVASGTAQLDYRDGSLNLAARLVADAGLVAAAAPGRPTLAGDIVVRGRAAPAQRGAPIAADIVLDLGERFHVRAAGLAARLVGQLRLRSGGGAGAAPLAASGSIATRDGTFEAYGQKLVVERGIVNFQGALDDPGLNVLALRKGGAVEAGVAVGGTLQRPVVRLVSTPLVPDAEKLSWIVLGRAPDAAGTDASLLLAAAGSFLGQDGAGEQLARAIGVDEFGLRQASGGETLASQILTVGKRLSARTHLSYEQGLSAATAALKLTHALTPRISVVTRAGADSAIDVFYSFSFD